MPREGLEPTLPSREADFKSAASAIPPPRQKVEAASGFEPLNRGFADPRLNHLATPPLIALERKTRFELATPSLARRCSTAELLPRVLYYIKKNV